MKARDQQRRAQDLPAILEVYAVAKEARHERWRRMKELVPWILFLLIGPVGLQGAECGVRTDPAGRHLPAFGQKDCGPAASRQPARAAEGAAILPANPPAQSAVTAPRSTLRTPHFWRVTAYCPCRLCCGPRACGVTASATPADHPLVAGPPEIRLGTRVAVPGYNAGQPVRVEDRGGAIRGRRMDVLFPTHSEAQAWGVRFLAVRFTAENAEVALK